MRERGRSTACGSAFSRFFLAGYSFLVWFVGFFFCDIDYQRSYCSRRRRRNVVEKHFECNTFSSSVISHNVIVFLGCSSWVSYIQKYRKSADFSFLGYLLLLPVERNSVLFLSSLNKLSCHSCPFPFTRTLVLRPFPMSRLLPLLFFIE